MSDFSDLYKGLKESMFSKELIIDFHNSLYPTYDLTDVVITNMNYSEITISPNGTVINLSKKVSDSNYKLAALVHECTHSIEGLVSSSPIPKKISSYFLLPHEELPITRGLAVELKLSKVINDRSIEVLVNMADQYKDDTMKLKSVQDIMYSEFKEYNDHLCHYIAAYSSSSRVNKIKVKNILKNATHLKGEI